MKEKLPIILKAIVSIGLLAFIFSRIDLAQIFTRIQYLSLPFVAFSVLYWTGCQWLSCIRWHVVLRATGHRVLIASLLCSYFSGMFVNTFLPGAFGGDLYRAYRVSRQIEDTEVAIASVFLERFTGLAAIFALALAGLPLVFKVIGSWDIILLFFVCLIVISVAVTLIASQKLLIFVEPIFARLRLTPLVARIAKIQLILRKFVQHRQALMLAIGLSLLIQLAIIFYLYQLAQQLKIPITYLELLVFNPISIVVNLLPISLGGLGVQEGLWAYLFVRMGIGADNGVLLSLTFTVLGWLISLPGGIILLMDFIRSPSRKLSHKEKE
jgi:glycosyltransferase 2 family protein